MKGGKRKGAGRPKGEPTRILSVRIKVSLYNELKNVIENFKKQTK